MSNEIETYLDLQALTAQMDILRSQITEIQEMNAELDEETKLIVEEMAKMADRKKAIDNLLFDSRRKVRNLQFELQENERRAAQAKAIADAENEFRDLVAEWDEITRDAPWREMALEHQLEGARRIAYSKSIILADVMGLGKTLTAIMALDLLLAAQPEPTVEHDIVRGYHRYVEEESDTLAEHCEACASIKAKPEGPSYGDTHYDHYGAWAETRIIPAAGNKILYVAPVSLIRNVQREFKKWAPYRENPIVLAGYSKMQRRMVLDVFKDMDKGVVLINYESWRKDLALIDDLIEVGFDTIVIDEAHNAKERDKISFKGVYSLITGRRVDAKGNTLAQGREIRNVIPMTGSPILNRPQELYSLLVMVDRKQFPNSTQGENAFLRDYCDKDPYTGKWVFKAGGLEALARKISNRFIRRTREDAGIVLPPQEVIVHELEIADDLYPEQAKARESMRNNAMILLNPARGAALVAAAEISIRLRLRQIETWPAGITLKDEDGNVVETLEVYESQKLDYVIAPSGDGEYDGLLTEVCPEERTVLFSQFKEPLREIERRANAAGIRTVILDGDTSQQKRDEIQRDFDRSITDKADAKWDLVLANYRVGGQGMNMTSATQMIILDEEWNPGKRDQAYDRLNRIGQTEETTVHVIRMAGTTDTWMAELIADKEIMIGGFNEQMHETSFFEALREGVI